MTPNEREGLKQEIRDRLMELLALAKDYDLIIQVNNLPADRSYEQCEVWERQVQ